MPTVLRGLARAPGFAITAIASLALAVGANAAIFSIVNALWLRPLPVAGPERLVVPYYPVIHSADGELLDSFRLPVVADMGALSSFEAVTCELAGTDRLGDWRPVFRRAQDAPPYAAAAVASNYFSVLGVRVEGRSFSESEDRWGSVPVAVISRRLWNALFGTSVFEPGRDLPTTSRAIPIVGVAASGFRGPRLGDDIDVWVPMGALPEVSDFASEPGLQRLTPVTIFARIRDGVSLDAAESEARSVLHAKVSLRPLREFAFPLRSEGGLLRQRSLVQTLWLAAGLVLVLGCANLAALFSARSLQRRRDNAIRLCLGARRGALVRETAAETALLAAGGLGAGLIFRAWLLRGIGALETSAGVPVSALDSGVDARVLLFAAMTAFLAAGLSSAGAVRVAARPDISILVGESGSGGTRWHRRLRQILLAVHAGLAAALLIAAAVLTVAVVDAFHTDAIYAREDIVVARVRPRFAQYPDLSGHQSRRAHDYASVIARLRDLPDVADVANGDPPLRPLLEREATPLVADGRTIRTPLLTLDGGPGYAGALGARVIEGEDLKASDIEESVTPQEMMRYVALSRMPGFKEPRPKGGQASVLIDNTLAELLWPGRSAVGRRFTWKAFHIDYTVRGVVAPLGGHPRSSALVPAMITPQPVGSVGAINPLSLVMRTNRTGSGPVQAVTRTLREAFPDAPVLDVRPASAVLEQEMARERMGARIFGYYAIAALVLALVGTHGLVTFMAHHARRELALRYALGASERAVSGLLVRRVGLPIMTGIAGGVVLAHALATTMAATVVGLGAMSISLSATAAVVFLVAGLAVAISGTTSLRRWNAADVLKSA